MKITKEWLKGKEACIEGYKWFCENYPTGTDHKELYRALQVKHKDWGYWLIVHIGGAEFGIRCAMAIYSEPTWVQWANDWLSGKDRAAEAAWAARAAGSAAWAAVEAVEAVAAWATAGSAARAAVAAKPNIDLLAILDECECMKAERSEKF